MKKTISRIAFGLVLLAMVYWLISSVISNRRSEAQKEKVKTEKHLQSEKSVADMVAKHNAVTDWKQNLNKKGRGFFADSVYTIEIEEALIRTDGRPILFFSQIEDIGKKSDKYIVYFANLFGFMSSVNVHFILDCTPEQFEKIMLHPRLFENHAVIAQVSEVKKVKLKLANYPEKHAVTDYDVAKIDKVVLEPSNVFIAKGCCLELQFVGDYQLSKDFLKAKPE